MSRVQLALNVDNLDEAVEFYSKLFNTRPAKLKTGYANFVVADPALKLVLLENPGKGGSLNHLGVEVESSETVHAEIGRLVEHGMFTEEEIGTTCCFATQDKVWVTGPGGEKWEIYTVLADSETFGTNPELLAADSSGGCSCWHAAVVASRMRLGPELAATAACRVHRHRVARHGGRRLRHRGPTALARRRRSAAPGELDRHRPWAGRSDPPVRPGVRRAPQSCCVGGRLVTGTTQLGPASAAAMSAAYAVAQTLGGILGAMLANVMFDRRSVRDRNQEPRHNRAPRRRDRRHRRADRSHLRPGAQRASSVVRRRGRRIHRRRVLVHQQHLVRQPSGHRRTDVLRHLRRDIAPARCQDSSSPRSSAAHRSGADRCAVPENGVRMTDSKPTVLFLCTHNAGRSQMALGYFNHLAGDQAVGWSGGSEPGNAINPSAVAVMARGRHRHHRGVSQALDRRDCSGGRRRRHHGMWRRVPLLPRQALRELGAARPRRTVGRCRSSYPRRHRTAGSPFAGRTRNHSHLAGRARPGCLRDGAPDPQ